VPVKTSGTVGGGGLPISGNGSRNERSAGAAGGVAGVAEASVAAGVAGVAASLADDVVTAATRSAASMTVDPMRAMGARANSEAGRVVDDKAGMQ
jgi:hypothetical protein